MRISKSLHPPIVLSAVLALLLLLTSLPLSAGARTDGMAQDATPRPNMAHPRSLRAFTYAQTLIEASDGASGDNFGQAVALDGDLLAVGAIDARLNGQPAGAVYLYERDPQSPTGWTEVHKLYGDPGLISPYFGNALALQDHTLIVGAPFHPRDEGAIQGKAYVYERHHGGTDNWGLVTELADEEDADGRWFGRAVAFDGDLVAVSAVGADDDRGKVYLYSRAAGWARIKAFSDPDGQPFDWFGSALALQGDTLVIGAHAADLDATTADTGAAFVYGRHHGGTDQWGLVARLVPDTPQADSFFGGTLALDGDTLAVGAYNEDRYEGDQQVASQVGAAYVFERNHGGPDAWGQTAALHLEDGQTLDRFGAGLALSADDLWVGAPNVDTGGFGDEGAVFHHRRDEGGSGAWGLLDTIHADPDSMDAAFGSALAAADQTLLAGAPYHEERGAAYLIIPQEAPDTAYLPVTISNWHRPTGILEDGGSLEDPTGAIIGAVPGTLNTPLPATIVAVDQPTTPLPPEYTPVGGYYFVSAERLTLAPNDKPFVLGLPVPPDANPDDLAMALLAPPGAVQDLDADTALWLPNVGAYDADDNLFVITLSGLTRGGLTVVLITDPAFEPIPPATAISPQATQGPVSFEVSCGPGDVCTDANKAWVVAALLDAYDDFVTTLKFERPLLIDKTGYFGEGRRPGLGFAPAYANIWIWEQPCPDQEDGHYLPDGKEILICLDPNNPLSPDALATVRHELFHAIQYAYPALSKDRFEDLEDKTDQTRWVTDGTATAAENSTPTQIQRNPDRQLFPVTTPLTSTVGLDPYYVQDFWVYTGLESSQTLAYLQGIFTMGATPAHVDLGIALDDAYWSWAKNQAIEHHITMDGVLDAGPCVIQFEAIDLTNINVLTYPGQRYVEGHLPPLTSALVEIHATIDRAFLPVSAGNDGNSNDMRFKVYELGEPNCALIDDGTRILQNVPAGAKYYVLVSNVSLTDPFNYIVEVD